MVGTVAKIQEAGKLAFVHFDLIAGIGKDQMGVRFLAHKIGADGLVTTRSNIILTAKQHHLLTIQRLFAFDSVSIDNGIKVIKGTQPDAIEVLPGMVVPRIVDRITMKLDLPIIAGGLITELTDVETALKCGAIGISTSTQQLWQWQEREIVKQMEVCEDVRHRLRGCRRKANPHGGTRRNYRMGAGTAQ